MEIRPLFRRPCSKLPTDMDICLCLLGYLLSQVRLEATKNEALEICNSPSEQNLVPENRSICLESDHSITSKKSVTDSSSSVKSTKELDSHLSLDVSDLEAASNRPMTNCEEGIVQSSPGQDTKETEQLTSSTTECLYAGREEAITQQVYKNTQSSVADSSVHLLNNQTDHLDVYQNQGQGPCEPGTGMSIPSSVELQLEIRQLEEQLKQSEEEKQKLSVELGKYLFLEDKEKRRGRLLGGAASLHDPG